MGIYDVWLQQSVGNADLFLPVVKQRLTDQFIQNWNSRINNSNRVLFYKTITCFQFQPYLECFKMNNFFQSITRLRVSSYKLQIETGRWNRPIRTPIDERKCYFCNVVEDEYHYVIECPIYTDLRKQFISVKFWRRPNMIKFIELIKTENKNVIRNLGMFIHKAFSLRNDNMYRQ